jgi:glycosyltransferase involved in cell wall biosynthesis
MNIAYVSTYNARDVQHWSGTGYYIAKALQDQNNEIEYTGELTIRSKRWLKIKELFYRARGCRYLRDREPGVARSYGAQVGKRISAGADVIVSPGTIPIAYLTTKKPKVFYTDATFAGILDFYPAFSNLCPETIKYGNEIEQAALSSCSLAIYSSDWAAQSAISNYEIDVQKVKVVPFGANIECNRTYSDVEDMIRNRSRSTCRLLFLGVDWERKGGELAVNIMKTLNAAGLKTELHVAGLRSSPFSEWPEHVINHGFISKSSPEGRARIDRLIADSHFLVLPTKAESFGIVFCEANSFGVPNIATLVGGVPTIVKDNVNGMLFPLSAAATDYAGYIYDLFSDYGKYMELALSSFNEYQSRLNWNVTGKRINELIHMLCIVKLPRKQPPGPSFRLILPWSFAATTTRIS